MQKPNQRKYHFIYKTVCLPTGKFYVGMHSTDLLDDSYLGSGKRLSRSVKKHGRENHKREIIESFNDRLSLIAREKEIITSELIKNPLCMNLILGGAALHRPATSEETRAKLSKAGKGRLHTELHKARMSAALKGRKHSPEEIENHRKAMIGCRVDFPVRVPSAHRDRKAW